MRRRFRSAFVALVFAHILAACGGGSGGITPSIGVTGTLTELVSGAAIAGATVTVGQQPPDVLCSGWAQCGAPLLPAVKTTTASNGTFTLPAMLDGQYFLTIAVDANPSSLQTYAILHRTVTAVDGTLVLGTIRLAKLSSDESGWLRDLNDRRAAVSFPATGAVVVDEYAEEQARQWASDVDAGKTLYTDAGFAPYQQAYTNDEGAIGNPAGALDGNTTWQHAEGAWFAEKANCAGGNWTTCVFAENTGHYVNLSESDDVWAGLGEGAATAPPSSGIGGYYPFDVMVILYGEAARNQ